MTAPDATGQPDGDQLREALAARFGLLVQYGQLESEEMEAFITFLIPALVEHTERIAAARVTADRFETALDYWRDTSLTRYPEHAQWLRDRADAALRAAHTTTEETEP